MTVFPDDNKKYLSTDLLREEPVRDGYLSPHAVLKGYSALGRVCALCTGTRRPSRQPSGHLTALDGGGSGRNAHEAGIFPAPRRRDPPFGPDMRMAGPGTSLA